MSDSKMKMNLAIFNLVSIKPYFRGGGHPWFAYLLLGYSTATSDTAVYIILKLTRQEDNY